MDFITQLTELFNANANSENASAMKSYMQDKFEFFGIKAGQRRELFKAALNDCKEEVSQSPRKISEKLYQLSHREYHMCAMEIIEKDPTLAGSEYAAVRARIERRYERGMELFRVG